MKPSTDPTIKRTRSDADGIALHWRNGDIGSHDLHIVKWAEREREERRMSEGRKEGRNERGISVIFTTTAARLPSFLS